jgi:HK97 family phage portal protein
MRFDLKRALIAQREGKAIPAHPALMDRATPVSIYSPGASRQDAVISQREAGRHVQAYGGDQAIDWVYDSIGLYSDAISTAPWRLEREDGTKLVEKRTKGTPPDHKLGPRELYTLLKKPNPFMLYQELVELLIIDLLLVGNAYWLKFSPNEEGKPLALYRLAPSYVKVVPGAFGVKSYEYQLPGSREKLTLSPEEVIHYKRPNPHSSYYGLGVIQGGGRAFDLELAITDTMASYYENRADPSIIVHSERRVPRDVFNKLRAQLRSRVAGSKRAGEMLLLEAGLKADTLSPSARDALFAELSRMSQDRVYAKFRTSRKLFGLLDTVGADSISDARREFDNATLNPFITRVQNMITDSLTTLYGVKFRVDYRYQMAVEDIVKTGTDFAATPGVKVREVRRFFAPLGIEESTGDPTIDEMVLNVPGEPLGPTGQGGLADNAQASTQPGRPAKGVNVQAFPKGGAPLPAKARVRAPKPQGKALEERMAAVLAEAARAEGKAVASDGANVSIGRTLTAEQRPSDPSSAQRAAQIDDAKGYINANLKDAVRTLERQLLDHAEGKALPNPSNKRSNVLQRVRNSSGWKAFRERLQTILQSAAKRAISSAVVNSGLSPADELDYDAIASSIVNRPDGVRGITGTLKSQITEAVRDARADDRDIQEAIQSTVRDWVENHMEAVADSEATEAYNEGTLSVAEAAGVENVVVTEEPDAPDRACQEADGQVWDLATARARRKEHPNCRRAFIPLAENAVA